MFSACPSTLVRDRWGRLLGAAVVLALVSTALVVPAPRAQADPVVAPTSGSFTVRGAGWGHGFGMSQYGAYGAARGGLTWKQILAFYYPGTRVTTMPSGTTLKVWITGDYDGSLRVRPIAGLNVRDADGGRYTLPTGGKYTSWRISRSGSGYRLSYRTSSGTDVTQPTGLSSTSTWSFYSPAKVIRVVLPSGSVRSYRGSVGLVKRGSSGRTVNRVLLEDYVKGVVPVEMPTSWPAEAVRAQSVAARSYAVRLRDFTNYSGYDICDTTACQVYRGLGNETSAGNAAVRATKGAIVTYKGAVALTQFASSNGGHSAQGRYPYLAPRPDPYDDAVRSQAWTKKVTTRSVAAAWPAVGTVRGLRITARDGAGAWGGRVRTIAILGSKATVRVSGGTFQRRFGLRSTLFTIARPTSPASPNQQQIKPGRAYATFPRSFDSDSRADLAVVSPSGQLRRYPVVGGRLGIPVPVGAGFDRYTHIATVGDWNGDGYADLVVRTPAGPLYLKRGSRTGQLSAGTSLPGGAHVRSMAGIGDANGDGRPDLALLNDTGNVWLVLGN
ncbi:MAG TPA: SpoIID/LytB domain-containing protein, partial [Propionibacteriaceae bacterium]|nr:SpoIID/LytB domain-containing protein [Propionibacteriaceae bacterium]